MLFVVFRSLAFVLGCLSCWGVRMILSCFLLLEEDSNCSLLFCVFSVVFNFIRLFRKVPNFLKVVLGYCASRLVCLRC